MARRNGDGPSTGDRVDEIQTGGGIPGGDPDGIDDGGGGSAAHVAAQHQPIDRPVGRQRRFPAVRAHQRTAATDRRRRRTVSRCRACVCQSEKSGGFGTADSPLRHRAPACGRRAVDGADPDARSDPAVSANAPGGRRLTADERFAARGLLGRVAVLRSGGDVLRQSGRVGYRGDKDLRDRGRVRVSHGASAGDARCRDAGRPGIRALHRVVAGRRHTHEDRSALSRGGHRVASQGTGNALRSDGVCDGRQRARREHREPRGGASVRRPGAGLSAVRAGRAVRHPSAATAARGRKVCWRSALRPRCSKSSGAWRPPPDVRCSGLDG
ncbi:hypothetical protein PCA20602_03453 [Pandoraea capi]|uniref:Uncharacterized protein n=1 Tax=Pandoraea capi TaxID=2508286 RepID=A0ABY6W578_9BURK|nr:hypothetical protein PCA20602_03453 [Pandoraea capi]